MRAEEATDEAGEMPPKLPERDREPERVDSGMSRGCWRTVSGAQPLGMARGSLRGISAPGAPLLGVPAAGAPGLIVVFRSFPTLGASPATGNSSPSLSRPLAPACVEAPSLFPATNPVL